MADIFSDYNERKSKVKSLVKKGLDYGWISNEDAKVIYDKLDNSILTIGVIGQMKAGKSTFLNSFVFQDDVLPAATTPMTAALSVITYGEEKKIEVEFYTSDEWAEQKIMSEKNLSEYQNNPLEESKIKAAKELVEKSVKLGSSLNSYLGKKQNDTLQNLVEYVGADGKYVSITKSVKIFYPNDSLKGVEIVDTPGFNDPIVSREERTKEFLKKADAVITLLYAGQPLSATDREILFKNVRQCGIGKVLIGINKYDIPYGNGEVESEIVDYVKSELKKACIDSNDQEFNNLIKETEPIAISAEMALLSQLSMQTIQKEERFNYAYKRHCDTFEISSQPQLREKSHIDDLIDLVKETIMKQKGEILFRKPTMQIVNAGKSKLEQLTATLTLSKNELKTLMIPDADLEEMLENVEKAERRFNRKIEGLGDDIDSCFKKVTKDGTKKLQDLIDSTRNSCRRIVDGLGRFESVNNICQPLKDEFDRLTNRSMPRELDAIVDKAIRDTKNLFVDFVPELNDLCERYISDYDYDEVLKGLERKLDLEVDTNLFSKTSYDATKNVEAEGFSQFLKCAMVGPLVVDKLFFQQDKKDNVISNVDQFLSGIESRIKPSLESINQSKKTIIDAINKYLMENLLTPIKENLENCRSEKQNKESMIEELKQKIEFLEKEISSLSLRIKEVENI